MERKVGCEVENSENSLGCTKTNQNPKWQIGAHKDRLEPTSSLAAYNLDDGGELQKLVLFVTELQMLLFHTQRRRGSGGA